MHISSLVCSIKSTALLDFVADNCTDYHMLQQSDNMFVLSLPTAIQSVYKKTDGPEFGFVILSLLINQSGLNIKYLIWVKSSFPFLIGFDFVKIS